MRNLLLNTATYNVLYVSPHSCEKAKAIKALEQLGYQVKSVSMGSDAFKYIEASGLPSLAIVDADETSDNPGITFCKMLRNFSDFPILFIAGITNTKSILSAMNPIIDDFMRKPMDLNELTMRVNRLIQCCIPNIQATTTLQLKNTTLTINYVLRSVTNDEKMIFLSEKEMKLFNILHQNSGEIVSASLLKDRLWPNETDPMKQTTNLGVVISRLRKKLDQAYDCPNLIKTQYKRGYWLDAIA